MRYKNPTPNPLIACDEGAKMYLIRAKTAVTALLIYFSIIKIEEQESTIRKKSFRKRKIFLF
jgi:hypothetical protein